MSIIKYLKEMNQFLYEKQTARCGKDSIFYNVNFLILNKQSQQIIKFRNKSIERIENTKSKKS